MQQPHRILARLAVLALLPATAALPSRAADAPYEINVIMPLTGAAAFLGKNESTALSVIEAYVNKHGGIRGRPVKFAVADDQSNPQVAVQLANAVIAKHAPVVLGSSFVATCNAMAPLMKTQLVEYCFSPGIHPEPNSYIFSSSVSTRDLANVYMRYFRDRGWKRVALLTSTDATGQEAQNNLVNAANLPANKDKGVTIVAREVFNPTDVSVAAQITRIKAANPQILVGWSTGTPFGTVLRGVNEAGLTIPIATTNGNMIYSQLEQYKAFLPRELYFPGLRFQAHEFTRPGPVRAAQDIFFTGLRAAGDRGDASHSFAWDPTMITIDAFRHIGTNATAEQLHDYLEKLHGYAGINGIYDFRDGSQRGLTQNECVIARWDKAKSEFVPVSRPGGQPL